jgi:hypothetical protein
MNALSARLVPNQSTAHGLRCTSARSLTGPRQSLHGGWIPGLGRSRILPMLSWAGVPFSTGSLLAETIKCP